MGLDIYLDDKRVARWSYSGFNVFRQRLAAQIGLSLKKMWGFGGEVPWDFIVDPIAPLLNHSDCEGHLTPEQCYEVGPRLRAMLETWPLDYDRSEGMALAAAMDAAAMAGKNLEFK